MGLRRRVSGMAVSSLRGIFAAALWKGTAQTDDSQGGVDETEYILWRIVQQEGSSAAGLAIWMCWKLAMQPGEVVNLSWSQTDFAVGVLHLPNRDVPMGNRMRLSLEGDVGAAKRSTNRQSICSAYFW